jgi:hypothetical protein
MTTPTLKTKRMALSEARAFIRETILRKDVDLTIIIALMACSRILFELNGFIIFKRRAQEFLGCLKQLYEFSHRAGIAMITTYDNKSYQIIYYYHGFCNAWVLSGPLWYEPLYPKYIYHPVYVGNILLGYCGHPFSELFWCWQPTQRVINRNNIFTSQTTSNSARNWFGPTASEHLASPHPAPGSYFETAKAEPVKGRDNTLRNIETTDSTTNGSAVTPPAPPAIPPNRFARCENWPTITQDFWPTENDSLAELIRKHGPTKTWYASSKKPSPPASALPIPSYYQNQDLSSTVSTSGSDAFISVDNDNASTAPTSPGIEEVGRWSMNHNEKGRD